MAAEQADAHVADFGHLVHDRLRLDRQALGHGQVLASDSERQSALAAAASSWVEYRLLRVALEWRIGPLPGLGHDGRWCLIAAGAAGVLAAGLRSVTDDLPRWVALGVVVVPAGLTYLAITATMAGKM